MEKMYNTAEAADLLKSWGTPFTKGTLVVWRSLKKGPDYQKIMGRVFYTEDGLLKFITKK